MPLKHPINLNGLYVMLTTRLIFPIKFVYLEMLDNYEIDFHFDSHMIHFEDNKQCNVRLS